MLLGASALLGARGGGLVVRGEGEERWRKGLRGDVGGSGVGMGVVVKGEEGRIRDYSNTAKNNNDEATTTVERVSGSKEEKLRSDMGGYHSAAAAPAKQIAMPNPTSHPTPLSKLPTAPKEKKKVLLFTMDSIASYGNKAKKGGPAGEILVRECLTTTLMHLSEDLSIDVARSDEEMETLGGKGKGGYDAYIFDPWTWAGKGWKMRSFVEEVRRGCCEGSNRTSSVAENILIIFATPLHSSRGSTHSPPGCTYLTFLGRRAATPKAGRVGGYQALTLKTTCSPLIRGARHREEETGLVGFLGFTRRGLELRMLQRGGETGEACSDGLR